MAVNGTDFIKTIPADKKPNIEKHSSRINAGYEYLKLGDLSTLVQDDSQGYLAVLSPYYFDGAATDTIVEEADIDTWLDVEIVIDENGTFDKRPELMQATGNVAFTGTGAAGSPIEINLEALTQQSYANFRASLSFNPEEDGGRLESRLLFTRHSGAVPSTQFPIEEVTLAMESGADVDYAAEPGLTFFVGDTIDTNAPGDAGSCRFQIKCDVPGVLSLRALTWYIQQ